MSTVEATFRLTRRLLPVAIVLLTVGAFFPVLQNGFVIWDDEKTLLENPNYRGFGWTELRWMFTTFHMGHYQPLSWLSFAFDYLVWGMDPFGYHLTNLLLHAANAVLFYFVALRLLSPALSASSVPGELPLRVAAGFAALLFSVHPLRVESVAWATERRDVLSGLFFLMTLLCYLKAVTGERGDFARWRNFALAAYASSLLSKAGGMTLPVVLLLLDIYPLRRLTGDVRQWFGSGFQRVLREKAPFFLLAVVFGTTALLAQQEAGALKALESYGVAARLAQPLFGIAFYLWKSALPLGLSPLYELPVSFNPWDWPFVLSGLAVVAVSICLYRFRRAWPAGPAIWIYYIVVLAPVLGAVQSGPQIAADRYSYLSCLGWALLGGAGLIYGLRKIEWRRSIAVPAMAGLAVLALGALTWKQTQIWRDSERLWRHALAVGPESSTAHYNLGYVLQKRGELPEAIGHYRNSLELNPAAADAHYYLGGALAELADLEGAVEHYRQALEIRPSFWGVHHNLAIVLERQGKLEEATQQYRQAVRINPASIEAHNNLGTVLARRGDLAEAVERFRHSLKLSPAQSGIRFTLGNILAVQGRLDEAAQHFRQALEIEPDFPQAHNNLGRILAAKGDLDQAVAHFRQAVQIKPDFAEAHESLGMAFLKQGKKEEAIKHYQEALRIMRSRRAAGAGG